MTKQIIHSEDAPQAIGTYSQAVRAGDTVYLSGQIGLDPATMQLADGIDAQIQQVFRNLRAVAAAAGATLDDAVKVTVFLTDLGHFARVNEIMAEYFQQALSRTRGGGRRLAAARRAGRDRGGSGQRAVRHLIDRRGHRGTQRKTQRAECEQTRGIADVLRRVTALLRCCYLRLPLGFLCVPLRPLW